MYKDTIDFEVKKIQLQLLDVNASSSILAGDTIQLQTEYNGSIRNIQWQPSGEVLCDSCLSTVAFPLMDQTFRLSVIDTNGCLIEADVFIRIIQRTSIYIPNAFSPNGDGINDCFIAYSQNIEGIISEIRISDR